MNFRFERWVWLFAISSTVACGGSSTTSSPGDAGSKAPVADAAAGSGGGTLDDASSGGASGAGAGGSTAGAGGVAGASGAGGVAGSAGAGGTGGGVALACDNVLTAIVTDIDATLTESDTQWILQLGGGSEPKARAGGSDLINGYADLGYYIVYLTARPEDTKVPALFGKETAREATDRWLTEHDFPRPERSVLLLAPTTTFGQATEDYKTGALQDLQSQGYELIYAYGNADTDIGAYEAVGIDKANTYIIGSLAGTESTQPISGDDFVSHAVSQLPTVSEVCDPAL
jgi:LNS2 (Lipin/Ned1/Smp2)